MDATTFDICRICDGSMIDPRILPCSHSFCLKCLESMTTTKCMTCQIDFEVPRGGLKELKKNVFIEQFIILNQRSVCCSCQKYQAVKFCTDCSINYCKTCLVHHKNFPLTRDHKLDAINIKSAKGKREKEFDSKICKAHEETMSIFCFDCDKLACVHCMLSEHNDHHLTHISNYSKDLETILTTNLKDKYELLGRIAANQEQIENLKSNDLSKATKLRKQVDERAEDMKKVIDSFADELKKNINYKLEKHHKKSDDVLSKLKDMETKLNAHINILENEISDLKQKMFIVSTPMKDKIEDVPEHIDEFDLLLSCGEVESFKSNMETSFGKITEALATATFQFTLNDISKSAGVFYSPACYIRNLPWQIWVDFNVCESGSHEQRLDLYLFCNMTSTLETWFCRAEFELRLLSSKEQKTLKRKYDDAIFCDSGKCYGQRLFISMKNLLDPENGFVKDDSVTFEAYVKAGVPNGTS